MHAYARRRQKIRIDPSMRYTVVTLFICISVFKFASTAEQQLYPPPAGGNTATSDDDELANAPWDEESSAEDEKEAEPPAKSEEPEFRDGGGLSEEETKENEAKLAKLPLVTQMMQKSEWDKIEKQALAGDMAMLVPNEYNETALHMASQPHNAQPKALRALIKLAPTEVLNLQVPPHSARIAQLTF